ncbi:MULTISPECIES: hypothetical protein [unclassified Bradyrhizobium]|uniref:hypothetical protein n=1 Tax=unclassified Bradyrhizobium TaxID=2631580 RepID=UPI001FFB24F0|nr:MULTISPECIES: hypothetical protein [unclassified Bradyrhizobium]MCK1539818.1 hypothetical protein [Bradyrhizobium sp. 176]MCK1561620.1 hypothetical protein [Bradyrhizobium sp. 171]MCK1698223.1 hypothetical protein [Bradyrhizobium sp. 144]
MLDPTNPRVGFSMRQLGDDGAGDAACTLLLTSQEDTESLKRSIILSGGVQEPIYLRHDRTVAEGNRRVVAIRAAKDEHPENVAFRTMPAWIIPEGTSEHVVQDLLNEIHLGSVRGWAPYEKALQMRALVASGLIEAEVAERYRMTTNDVRQHIDAANLMDRLYFPITDDPTDAEHRSKYSYFLEFVKNGRIQRHRGAMPDLPERFAGWVRDGRVDTGMKVRKLPKILDAEEAIRLLEIDGFDAAEEYLSERNPREQEMYLLMERARARLADMSVVELVDAKQSPERIEILKALRQTVTDVLDNIDRVVARDTPRRANSGRRRR